jgi:hypothetical protein
LSVFGVSKKNKTAGESPVIMFFIKNDEKIIFFMHTIQINYKKFEQRQLNTLSLWLENQRTTYPYFSKPQNSSLLLKPIH